MLKSNLLVVESDDEFRFELEGSLMHQGFTLFQTSKADDIFDMVIKEEISIVLLGPAIDVGKRIEVCRTIKGADETRGVAVVFASIEGELMGVEVGPGADEYMVKPYNINELLAKLRSLYKIHEYQEKLESLVEFARAINSLEYDEIRKSLEEWMNRILPADRFSVFIYSDDNQKLHLLSKTGGGKDMEKGLTINPKDSPIMNHTLRTGETNLVTDFQGSQFYTGHQRKYNDGYALCLPLKIGKDILGAMNLSGESGGFFSNLDLSYVSLISEVIASSLQNARMHKVQKKLAITDGLTGLTNRRRFQELLTYNFNKEMRYKRSLSCIICDIDHFKNVNDNFGHLAGDAVLEQISGRMKKHLREVDIIARYGGEEFVMLLPETDRDGAFIVGERIREDVAAIPFDIPGGTLDVTISMGICDNSEKKADTGEALVDCADKALYYAKDTGRNRTVVFEERLSAQE